MRSVCRTGVDACVPGAAKKYRFGNPGGGSYFYDGELDYPRGLVRSLNLTLRNEVPATGRDLLVHDITTK